MTENIFIFAAYSVITGSITCAIILLINKIVYNRTSAAFMKYLMGFGLVSFVFPSYMIYFFIEGIDRKRRADNKIEKLIGRCGRVSSEKSGKSGDLPVFLHYI